MCYISGFKKEKYNDNTARRVQMGQCKGQTSILRRLNTLSTVFRNKADDSFWRTPGGKHQEEDGLLSFSMKVNGKKDLLSSSEKI